MLAHGEKVHFNMTLRHNKLACLWLRCFSGKSNNIFTLCVCVCSLDYSQPSLIFASNIVSALTMDTCLHKKAICPFLVEDIIS
jgi:hypothetical protein